MKSTIVDRLIFSSLLLVTLILINGCTHMYEQPIHEINLPTVNDKININVGIILTDEFRNAKWEKEAMGETWILPIGENLVHDTNQLVERVFSNPVILDEGIMPKDNTKIRYILKPKVAFVEQSYGVSAFSTSNLTIGVEWNLSDLTGKSLWVETVTGVGTGIAGNMFTGQEHQEERLKAALQDLFQKSQETMLGSNLLRNLR